MSEASQPNTPAPAGGIAIPISPKVLGSVLGLLLAAMGVSTTLAAAPPAVLERLAEVKTQQVETKAAITILTNKLTAATMANTASYERLQKKLEKLADRVLELERR